MLEDQFQDFYWVMTFYVGLPIAYLAVCAVKAKWLEKENDANIKDVNGEIFAKQVKYVNGIVTLCFLQFIFLLLLLVWSLM